MRWSPILFLVLFSFTNTFSQQDKSASKRSYSVSFRLTDGTRQSGTWLSSTDTSILFLENNDTVTLTPAQIYKFEIRKTNSIKRNTIIGASFGFAVGFAIGYTGEEAEGYSGASRVGHAAGAGLIGAFSGALFGHLSGMLGKSYFVLGSRDQYKTILSNLQKYTLQEKQ
ncbi:MAG: hypothetical protein OEU76_01890 [Cyclobacteriaceae bacterium]|nr:hypothetical protein [Cyclobacteriaceae bacterium]